MKNSFFTKHKGVCVGIISTVGFVSCSIIVLLSWLTTRIYVYDYSTTLWMNKLVRTGMALGIIIILLILVSIFMGNHSKKEAILLIIFCLIFSISIYSSCSLSKKTIYTLIDPIVITKIDGEDIVVVQGAGWDRTVAIKCTKSEYTLLTTGYKYASLIYIGNDEEGILQEIWTYMD